MKSLAFIYFSTFFISCGGSVSPNFVSSEEKRFKDTVPPKGASVSDDSSTFYPLKNDLYINKFGEVAYRAYDKTVPEDIRYQFLLFVNNFDTTKFYDQQKEIRYVVDTATFEFLGDLYYLDKRYAYYHFPTMDGGFFSIIWGADMKTFHILGASWYAKDKFHIYSRGNILEPADYRTFTVFPLLSNGDTVRWLGKDKYNFYDGNEILDKRTIKEWNLK